MQNGARYWLGLGKPVEGALAYDDDDYPAENFAAAPDAYAARDAYEAPAEDEYLDDEYPVGQLAMGTPMQVAIVRLRHFQDAATVGDYFRQAIPVIINLEEMDKAEATRMIDFVSGLIVGLRGDLERISPRAFLITPARLAAHGLRATPA